MKLHFQFWSGAQAAGSGGADALGYTCLHLSKHVLRGSARPFHAYEVARFLDTRAGDTSHGFPGTSAPFIVLWIW